MNLPPQGKGGARPGAGRKAGSGKSLFAAAIEACCTQEDMDDVVRKMVAQAKAGDARARRELLDRILGRPKVTAEISSDPVRVFWMEPIPELDTDGDDA